MVTHLYAALLEHPLPGTKKQTFFQFFSVWVYHTILKYWSVLRVPSEHYVLNVFNERKLPEMQDK